MKEFNSPMKIYILEKLPHKEDVLGQIVVPLGDVDRSGDLHKFSLNWKKRKRSGKVAGKLRVELGYVTVSCNKGASWFLHFIGKVT